MQKIILICGFGGSGKSTLAELCFKAQSSSALVRADDLFIINPLNVASREGRAQIGRLKLRNALCLVESYIEESFKNIIVEGLVWSQQELDHVCDLAKKHGATVECIWLKTSKDVRHSRVLNRARDEADSASFLDVVGQNIADPTPLNVMCGRYYEIETDDCTPDEIFSCISDHLSSADTEYLLCSKKNAVHLERLPQAHEDGDVEDAPFAI